ncbi:hypothetical protein ACFWXO_26700 [Kitasatospora sp. NPDC059088]|uniref:hypothetical protein n=1 Tax=Kitasatospora sp. NPDC059088 TaxID=3346722 RepID=UPI0036C1F943
MVEFLRKLLLDEFDPYPLSIDLRDASPRYVHWFEPQRRSKAGLDRYSGEPRSANQQGLSRPCWSWPLVDRCDQHGVSLGPCQS